MTDIVAFLNARLDEDEQLAREASAFYDDDQTNGVPWNGHEGKDLNGFMRYWIAPHLGVVNDVASGRHIGRHDPARVLAEVKAKREIVQFCDDDPPFIEGGYVYTSRVLQLLAGAYANHPDYDPAWAVT